jgi:integrase
MFAIAVDDKAIAANPAATLKPRKVVKPIRITPSFEEFTAIIADVRKQKFNAEAESSADYLEFMGLIGVGQAEASSIQKQHVNLPKKQLTFFRAKTKTPYVVPIFPQAEALVKKLVSGKGMNPTDYLFPVNMVKSMNDCGSSRKDSKQALNAACKRLGCPQYTQRSLRRMFITRCIELGIDIKVIADWQGHQDGGELILGTYSHVRNVHADEMAKKLTVATPAVQAA